MALLYNLLPSASRRLVFRKHQQNIEKLQFYNKSALSDQLAATKAQGAIEVEKAAELKPEETVKLPQVKFINICILFKFWNLQYVRHVIGSISCSLRGCCSIIFGIFIAIDITNIMSATLCI